MSSGKRCFKNKSLTNKVVKSRTSMVLPLKKLTIKIEANLIVPNVINCSDSDSRKKVKKNNLKYEKRTRKVAKFGNKSEEAFIYSSKNISEKMLKGCNSDTASMKTRKKLNSIQSVNNHNIQFNSVINKFPRVVLERLPIKIEKIFHCNSKYSVDNKNKVDDKLVDKFINTDENVQESTNIKTDLKHVPEPENNVTRSALTESQQMCINKIKNEFDDEKSYLDTTDASINNCDMMDSLNMIKKTESTDEINDFETITYEVKEVTDDFDNKDNINNDMQLEFQEAMYEDIKDDDDNGMQTEFNQSVNNTNYLTEDFVNTDDVVVDIQIKENEYLIDDKINIALKCENVCKGVEIEHNSNETAVLQIHSNEMIDDVHAGKVIHESLTEGTSSSSQNSNLSSQLITGFEVAVTNESDTKLYICKCLICNIVESQEGTRICKKKCKVCNSNLYYECLICQNKYRSVYTLYSHLRNKHSVNKSIMRRFEKSKSVSAAKLNSLYEKNFLSLAQYHDKKDTIIFRTVPDPISAFCVKCHKKVLATKDTVNWCDTCKIKYIFLCNNCDYIRKSFLQVRLHVLHSHAKKILKCPYCERSFSYSRTHLVHMNSCQNYQSVDTESHLTKMSKIQFKSYCYKCGKYFENRQSMAEHINDCGKSNLLSCKHCNFKTDLKSTLENHLQTEHTGLSVKMYCYKCGKYFENRQSMAEHINDCEGSNSSLCCNYCNFETELKSMLKNHLRKKHRLISLL